MPNQRAYTEEMRPAVEYMMDNRTVIVVEPVRIRSWDHRKFGIVMYPDSTGSAT